jgi:hypothetical protein
MVVGGLTKSVFEKDRRVCVTLSAR